MFELQFVIEEIFALDPIPLQNIVAVWTVADLVQLVGGQIGAGRGSVPDGTVVEAMRAQHDGSQRITDVP